MKRWLLHFIDFALTLLADSLPTGITYDSKHYVILRDRKTGSPGRHLRSALWANQPARGELALDLAGLGELNLPREFT